MTSNRSKTVPNIPKRYLNIILLCFTVFYGDYGLISVILTILVRFWSVLVMCHTLKPVGLLCPPTLHP